MGNLAVNQQKYFFFFENLEMKCAKFLLNFKAIRASINRRYYLTDKHSYKYKKKNFGHFCQNILHYLYPVNFLLWLIRFLFPLSSLLMSDYNIIICVISSQCSSWRTPGRSVACPQVWSISLKSTNSSASKWWNYLKVSQWLSLKHVIVISW